MESITLSKASWHFRLATVYSNLKLTDWYYTADSNSPMIEEPLEIDSCTYIQHVMKGLLLILVLTALFGGIIVAPFSDLLMWAVVSAQYGFVQMNESAVFFSMLLTAVALVAVLALVLYKSDKAWKAYREYRGPNKHVSQKKTSFLRVLYTKIHDKTCVMVKFK